MLVLVTALVLVLTASNVCVDTYRDHAGIDIDNDADDQSMTLTEKFPKSGPAALLWQRGISNQAFCSGSYQSKVLLIALTLSFVTDDTGKSIACTFLHCGNLSYTKIMSFIQ